MMMMKYSFILIMPIRGIVYIPSPGINIDTSVNVAFAGDRLNAAKSYADLTD